MGSRLAGVEAFLDGHDAMRHGGPGLEGRHVELLDEFLADLVQNPGPGGLNVMGTTDREAALLWAKGHL